MTKPAEIRDDQERDAQIAAVLAAVNARRAAVLDTIKRVDTSMADQQFCAARIAAIETGVYSFLFERGCNDPRGGLSADFVAWLVDRELWRRCRVLSATPFPYEDKRPDSAREPLSGKMRSYMVVRLAIIRLDHPKFSLGSSRNQLLRPQEPLSDAGVRARGGGPDASGLNAAIIVLRQVYGVLLTLLDDAQSSNDTLAANAHRNALDTLRGNEGQFSLLASAWLNVPTRAQSAHATRQVHDNILDSFFTTWEGSPTDLSFSSIMNGEQATRSIWSHGRFLFYLPGGIIQQPDGTWTKHDLAVSDIDNAKVSRIRWSPTEGRSLSDELEACFAPWNWDGGKAFMFPTYPSVLRIHYIPGDDDRHNLEEAEIPDIRLRKMCKDGEATYEILRPATPPFTYKLVAAVRRRNWPTEPDLVRIFDVKTAKSLGPVFPAGTAAPFALAEWRLGAAGHKYDLFYARVCAGHPLVEEGLGAAAV